MDKENIKLLPCPICGGRARLLSAEKDNRRQTNKIECTNKPCIEITRSAFFGINDIVKLWNTRVISSRLIWLEDLMKKAGLPVYLKNKIMNYADPDQKWRKQ